MSNLLTPIMGPGPGGITPGNGSVLVRNVSAATIGLGQVVVLDISQVDADTASVVPGHVNSSTGAIDNIFGCVVPCTSLALQRTGQFLILLESIAAGAVGRAAVTGIVPAIISLRAGDYSAKGMPLIAMSTTVTASVNALQSLPAVASASNDNVVAGHKIIGYVLNQTSWASSDSSSATTALMNVWFNGLGAGFGNNAA